MPSELYDLGELEHIHNGQNLKLKTNINITLSSSNFATILSSFPLDLETLISSGVWIAGSNRLLLHIHVLFHDIVISDIAEKSFIEDIGVMLCNAEVQSSTLTCAGVTDKPIDLVTTSLRCFSDHS